MIGTSVKRAREKRFSRDTFYRASFHAWATSLIKMRIKETREVTHEIYIPSYVLSRGRIFTTNRLVVERTVRGNAGE